MLSMWLDYRELLFYKFYKQPKQAMENRKRAHDHAKLYTFVAICQKWYEFKQDVFLHPPYSPNLHFPVVIFLILRSFFNAKLCVFIRCKKAYWPVYQNKDFNLKKKGLISCSKDRRWLSLITADVQQIEIVWTENRFHPKLATIWKRVYGTIQYVRTGHESK